MFVCGPCICVCLNECVLVHVVIVFVYLWCVLLFMCGVCVRVFFLVCVYVGKAVYVCCVLVCVRVCVVRRVPA